MFDEFHIEGPGWTQADREFSRAAREAALDVAAEMAAGDPGHVFALVGNTTVGKTFLMRLLWRFWLRSIRYWQGQGEPPLHCGWINWPQHHWQELEDHETTRFLVIDEIGRGARSKKADDWDKLVTLISLREARKLWTGVTANLTFDEIKEVDLALAERLRRNGSVCIQALGDVRPFTEREAV